MSAHVFMFFLYTYGAPVDVPAQRLYFDTMEECVSARNSFTQFQVDVSSGKIVTFPNDSDDDSDDDSDKKYINYNGSPCIATSLR